MKQMSYCRPYTVLGSQENPVKPRLILHGFVELRDDDRVLAVLQSGTVLGIESVFGNNNRYYTYVSVGNPAFEIYDDESSQVNRVIAETISQILQWSYINRMPVEDRIKGVLSVLASGGRLLITIKDLARICGVTRVWASKVIIDLEEQGVIAREDGWFSVKCEQ